MSWFQDFERIFSMSEEEAQYGPWLPGKSQGSVDKNRNQWRARYDAMNFYKGFSALKYGDQEAKELAEKALLEFNILHGLTKNDYRRRDADIIEMKLNHGHTVLIDTEHYPLVKDHFWHIWRTKGRNIYVGTEGMAMHQLFLPDAEMVDHINGTHIGTVLDNRMSNLRDSDAKRNTNNRSLAKTNTTGVNGVYPYTKKNEFRAMWVDENGKKQHKTFGYGPKSKRTMTEAFKQAIAFREMKDIENQCTNGIRGGDKEKAIERMKEYEAEQNAKRFKANPINSYFNSVQ